MFPCRQSSSWRVAKCRLLLSGRIQCFMLNVSGLKVKVSVGL